MHPPLTYWYCDVCGEIIESANHAYVIWREDDAHLAYDFHIIHQSRCDNERSPASMDLRTFLGPEGLNYLFAMLVVGPIKNRLGDKPGCCVKDMDEFVDFMRRVQTPYYEEARRKFNDQEVLEALADANEVYPYQEDVLRRVITEY